MLPWCPEGLYAGSYHLSIDYGQTAVHSPATEESDPEVYPHDPLCPCFPLLILIFNSQLPLLF
jgi:hypothetical protein